MVSQNVKNLSSITSLVDLVEVEEIGCMLQGYLEYSSNQLEPRKLMVWSTCARLQCLSLEASRDSCMADMNDLPLCTSCASMTDVFRNVWPEHSCACQLFHPLHSKVPYRCNSCRTWVRKVGGMNTLDP